MKTRKLRLPIRFSLTSLALVVTITSVALALWSQVKQQRKIARMTDHLAHLEQCAVVHGRLDSMLAALDLDNKQDREAFGNLQHFLARKSEINAPLAFGSPMDAIRCQFLGAFAQTVDIDGDKGDLNVLVLYANSQGLSHHVSLVACLFWGDKFIDVVSVRSPEIYRSAKFVDLNEDMIVDIQFECVAGLLSTDKPTTIDFIVSPDGFLAPRRGSLD